MLPRKHRHLQPFANNLKQIFDIGCGTKRSCVAFLYSGDLSKLIPEDNLIVQIYKNDVETRSHVQLTRETLEISSLRTHNLVEFPKKHIQLLMKKNISMGDNAIVFVVELEPEDNLFKVLQYVDKYGRSN